MKNKTLAKKFYVNSKNYIEAINILSKKITNNDNEFVIYPLLYLERHTVELMLKSLILVSVNTQELDEKMTIGWNGKKFDISKTHSLEILLNKYIEIQNETRLIPNYDNDINEVKKVICSFDKLDHSGEYYKYPLSKEGKESKQKLFKRIDEFPEVKSNMGNTWIFDFNEEANEDIKIVKLLDKRTLLFYRQIYKIILYFNSILENTFK